MTTINTRDHDGPPPYHAAFIRRFVSEMRPGSLHLLRAPLGTGVSVAVVGCMSELVGAGRIHRSLVLSPRVALSAQWASRLESQGLASVMMDGRSLRLLVERVGNSPGGWPGGAYCMTIQLATRPGVQELVSAVAWDLVVVDEAHVQSNVGAHFLEMLVENQNPPSVLLLANARSAGTLELNEKATTIDWTESVAEFRQRREQTSGVMLVRETRIYRRTDEEVEIAAAAVAIARDLGDLRGLLFLGRAASSSIELENMLVRWLDEPQTATSHGAAFEDMLARVEALRVDSRLACFLALVEELLRAGTRHVVAFCEYRSTLDYLAAAVERFDFPRFTFHAGMDVGRRDQSVSRFVADGGLLITTAAASDGLSLSFVDAAIHYDLPMTPAAFAHIEGRYTGYDRNRSCTVYFLEDERGALPLEKVLLRMVSKSDLVGDTEVDMSALFRAVVK